MSEETLTTNRKALNINLDVSKYGTLAEIGAGQEVARHFFKVGAAAGTVAKSMSAYDMKFSDDIYGKARRYVSQERLQMMLKHEFRLLQERLGEQRGDETCFFAFADTVAARNFKGTNECHGWMGVRFQKEPNAPASEIEIHVRMLNKTNLLQQEALGIIGVNLIHGAFYNSDDPTEFIKSLADNLGTDRIEVDMLQFRGHGFENIDNRIISLKLVEYGFTNAVFFDKQGEIQQPSEVLYKKAVILERGSFRPVTNVNIDMLERSRFQFYNDQNVDPNDVEVLFEITMNKLIASEQGIDYQDFLARIEVITASGYNVLISNYFEYFKLSAYFRRYTQNSIGLVMGVNNLIEVFNESYYENLDGGIMEAFGRLFKSNIRLYIYPMGKASIAHYKEVQDGDMIKHLDEPAKVENLITADNLQVPQNLQGLYTYLMQNRFISPVLGYNLEIMNIFSRDIIQRIQSCDPSWEESVPEVVVKTIKERKLWGYECDNSCET